MPPIRTYTDWNKRPSDHEDQMEPFRKYVFICEGANTEVWYFRKLMDMLGFLRLRAWDAQREHEKKKPRHAFIDEVWSSVKP